MRRGEERGGEEKRERRGQERRGEEGFPLAALWPHLATEERSTQLNTLNSP